MTRTTARNRRRGISLVEVLVAIFVMAIGLMALLTLFPLGALNMAQAIKDDRTGTAAANSAAYARTLWKAAVEANPSDPDNGLSMQPAVAPTGPYGGITIAMLGPNAFVGSPNPPLLPYRTTDGLTLGATNAILDAPSYPVYIDQFGFQQYPNPSKRWIAGQPPGAANPAGSIPRCVLNSTFGSSSGQLLSLFSSPDDLNLGDLGVPQTGPGVAGQPQRDQQYSWAYMLRRSNSTVANIVDMTVVVYRGRSLQFTQDLVPSGETMFNADFGLWTVPATNPPVIDPKIATLFWNPAVGQNPPNIKAGQWILDATMKDVTNPLPTYTGFIPHGYFYRVVSVSPGKLPNSMDLELQTPTRLPTPGPEGKGFGRAVIMDNVIEVFEKASLVP